ncbi:guanine nucleotide-binding protein subunit gamma-e-like [Convolutriloba macropyga]|uniref:guanine nucleotide-binding protein subunit gamma-e-like n=1 Tax=Convolutriloba macropyga TaxID=536237 RepID=UPI003F51D1AB
MSDKSEQRTALLSLIEQLKYQANMKREPISVTVQGLIDFMENEKEEDHFVNPVRENKNPYADKAKCDLL